MNNTTGQTPGIANTASGAADLPEALIGAIMAAAYDFRDAHISGSKNLKRTAHAELESTVRNTLHALAAWQATAGQPAALKNLWLGALDIRMAQGCGLKGDRLPVLYTDTINGDGVCRDDLWLCTSEALKPAEPVAEPADTVVLNAAMRAIQQAIELIGAPTDERMRAVRRVLRGAVIVAEDAGKVAPLPVARVQLTPERVKEIVRGAGYDQCGIPDTERSAFINGLRHGEHSLGIKGGQHGTE